MHQTDDGEDVAFGAESEECPGGTSLWVRGEVGFFLQGWEDVKVLDATFIGVDYRELTVLDDGLGMAGRAGCGFADSAGLVEEALPFWMLVTWCG